MTFDEVLAQVQALLQREKRVSYRGLKRRFALDDEYLEDLKEELIGAKRLATDEDGRFLLWTGTTVPSDPLPVTSPSPSTPSPQHLDAQTQTLDSRRDAGERRQLTVQFIDLVGSTTLSQQLDPEELRLVIQAYRETCASVIRRFEGYLAKYIGDGLLMYFGYPQAHEDDAQRAVRAGLEIVAELPQLNAGLQSTLAAHSCAPLQVRIGIHTGLVVAGEMGVGDQPEPLGIVGETPNIAARLQGLAEPDTVVISAATHRLVQGLFEFQSLGPQTPKGIATPLSVYRVRGESAAQSRFEAAIRTGLTALVGREPELGFLRTHWEQAKTGAGQVVLLSGEPGIGKSRLVQEFKDQLEHTGVTRIEFRCSPYHQNSAFYPIIDHLQRLLQFARDDSPATKLEKLQRLLNHYRFPQADTVPLLAALLSLPRPEGYPPLALSPQKQKEKMQAALVAWLVEEAEQQPVYNTWEDVHWADPSTREVLNLVVDQAPTARLYVLLTFRPEFLPPWGNRSHLSQMTLSRLGRSQVEAMVERVTGGKPLPPEVVQQIVAKTDGVPLFVEELTKTVVESGLLTTINDHYELNGPLPPLAIPSTLHASLLARLDRLSTVREIAQLGATLGREFSYELLQTVSPLDEATLQHGLKQLVEAELVYQRGLVPRATYIFKHALIQDTAYQSLLKSTRQQYHRQIAQVIENHFPETKEIQPELVAHHYTEAGLGEQAIPYWQQAGQRAVERCANAEAISHLTRALDILTMLPNTPQRAQQELRLQLLLGTAYLTSRSYTVPEVGQAYNRAYALCQELGDTPQHVPVLLGLYRYYLGRPDYNACRQLGEQLLSIGKQSHDTLTLVTAHYALGSSLFCHGEAVLAHTHLEQGMSSYALQQRPTLAFSAGLDSGVGCLVWACLTLWVLGYPTQAHLRRREALARAEVLAHPSTQVVAALWSALLFMYSHDAPAAQEEVESAIARCREHGNAFWLGMANVTHGWALTEQGREAEGIAIIQQGLAALDVQGAKFGWTWWQAMLAQAYAVGGQSEEGLRAVAEGLATVKHYAEHSWEAELYRLKGELTLQSTGQSHEARSKEAEDCFYKAIAIARRQQAKSWELRAATSLARLWQQYGKPKEAHWMLAEIYNWFTEGFDTKDLQEAKALLDELS